MKGIAAQVFARGSVFGWLRDDCWLGEPGEATRVLAQVDPSAVATGSCIQPYHSAFLSNSKKQTDSKHPGGGKGGGGKTQEFTSTEVYFPLDALRRSLRQRYEHRQPHASHMRGQRGSRLWLQDTVVQILP